MVYFFVRFVVYMLCFILSFWALSNVQFQKFTNVSKPGKTQLLLLLLSMALAYLCGQFLLSLSMGY
ncbi:DUF1146 family protein [[Eubacterium] hominis]|uniref:DUF1146 family protein n=1 Tax=[Eubacterium] hominis TaxID=2764325 RepID=UPI003A4DE535